MGVFSRWQFLTIYVCVVAVGAAAPVENNIHYETTNNNVTLSCSKVYKDEKVGGILWYKNSIFLASKGSSKTIRYADNSYRFKTDILVDHSLVLYNVKVEDTGNYTCKIYVEDSQNAAIIERNVTRTLIVQDTSFTLEPSDGFVSLGDNYTFILRLSQPDIRTDRLLIFKRRDPAVNKCSLNITTGEKFAAPGLGYDCGRGQEDGSYYLHISGVSKNDSGTWYCQYGITFSNNVSLDVKYPPTVTIQPVGPCKGFTYSVEDRNVSLSCRVLSANPTPTIFRWYHSNTLVGEGQMYLITRAKRSSEGLYRCEADNGEVPHGEDAITVNVHYPPVVKVPRNSFIVSESRDLDIPCTADANPNTTSIVWTKEGLNARIGKSENVLKLRNVKKTDSGTYICKAENIITRCDGSKWEEIRKVEVKVEVQCAPPMDRHALLGTGVGIGVAVMIGITGVSLIVVFIFRKKATLCLSGSEAVQSTAGHQVAEVHYLRATENEAEERDYDMPGNKYEDLRERTVEPPKTYEQLRTYQNV